MWRREKEREQFTMATKAGTMTSSLGDVGVQLPAPGNNNSPVPVIDNVGAIMALHWLHEQLHNNNNNKCCCCRCLCCTASCGNNEMTEGATPTIVRVV